MTLKGTTAEGRYYKLEENAVLLITPETGRLSKNGFFREVKI